MDGFSAAAALLSFTAFASYLNHRFLGLPTTIGLLAIGLVASLCVIALGKFVPEVESGAVALLERIDFDDTLMHALLGFLLFAGALHVNLDDLWDHAGPIAALATIGLLVSTALVGAAAYLLFGAFGIDVPFAVCLVFGALISPTDPIAVLAILKSVGAPKSLETQIAGESLFNDGVAVVLFLGLCAVAGLSGHGAETAHASLGSLLLRLFVLEVVGGVAFGLAIGGLAYSALRSVDNYEVEILISLALVAGGYALAQVLHVSGPLAMVVAGLWIGNHGRRLAMSDSTREHLDTFWRLLDEVLNAVLFVLIGLEVLVIHFEFSRIAVGMLLVPCILLGRLVAVAFPVAALWRFEMFPRHAIPVLTWGGLRGGISVALALSLQSSLGSGDRASYEAVVVATYVVVVFSIGVQGLTIAPLLRRLGLAAPTTVRSL